MGTRVTEPCPPPTDACNRARRKIENTQFRRELLIEYERVLFPPILSSICDRLLIRKRLDLAPVAPVLSVGLAAKRAGLDFDENSVEQLQALVDHVDAFSQGLGPGIVGQEDPAAAHARVMEALKNFERGFVRPSWERRSRLLEQPIGERPESLPDDILTKLLLHRDEPELELSDDSRIVREVATYLQGGTHSSAQTMMHALYFLFVLERDKPQVRDQILADRLFAPAVGTRSTAVAPSRSQDETQDRSRHHGRREIRSGGLHRGLEHRGRQP